MRFNLARPAACQLGADLLQALQKAVKQMAARAGTEALTHNIKNEGLKARGCWCAGMTEAHLHSMHSISWLCCVAAQPPTQKSRRVQHSPCRHWPCECGRQQC